MHRPRNTASGFTLIELLVVIAIIGILSSVVLASLNTARSKSRVARAASDLKQLDLVLNFYLDNTRGGVYPCYDHSWSDIREGTWSAPYIPVWPTPPFGLVYHWEHGLQGFRYSISINAPGQANAEALDTLMDDGNLSTGIIKGNGTRLEYGGMDQTAILEDCHALRQ